MIAPMVSSCSMANSLNSSSTLCQEISCLGPSKNPSSVIKLKRMTLRELDWLVVICWSPNNKSVVSHSAHPCPLVMDEARTVGRKRSHHQPRLGQIAAAQRDAQGA